MKRLLAPVFLLALLAALPAGCANPAKLIAVGLKIEVTAIERAADGTITAAWHVDNSNVVAYLVSRVSHKIYLNGTYLGAVEENEPMAIPAGAKAGRTSKLSGGDVATARVITEAAAGGSGSYRIDTVIVFRLYDEEVQRSELAGSGTATVTAK
jgi:LEA14-like dessication related protein